VAGVLLHARPSDFDPLSLNKPVLGLFGDGVMHRR